MWRISRIVFALFTHMALCVEVPKWKLNNGGEMPAIALGTYLGFDQNGVIKPETTELRDVFTHAIEVGWRHFDTASIYGTEAALGEAIRMKIDEGVVSREDIFVTDKLWNTDHKREQVMAALKESLRQLGLNYVDLYLMHWPVGLNEDYSHSDVDYMETWRGMEDAVKLGLAKSIGISNFNKEQLVRVLEEGTIKPAALEIEIHPQITQNELVDFAQSQGLVVMGYSPFGGLVSRFGLHFGSPRIDEPALVEIADKYGKTTPQIVLRWQINRNIVPIPKTTNLKRLQENIDVFDFKLDKDEMDRLSSYDKGIRYTFPSFWQSHKYYPFEKTDHPIADPFKRV